MHGERAFAEGMITHLPIASRCGAPGGAAGAFIFAPWLTALPRARVDLLSLLPVVDINGLLSTALEVPPGPNEHRDLAVAALLAVDPFLRVRDFARRLQAAGVRRVTNFPPVELIDSDTARAFQSSGLGAHREVEVLKAFRDHGLETLGVCCSRAQARALAEAGVQALILHPGVALQDWRQRTTASLAISRVMTAMRSERPELPLLVYRPDGFGAELDQAVATGDGLVWIADEA